MATRDALAALAAAQRASAAVLAGDREADARLRDSEADVQRTFSRAVNRLAAATEERRTLGLLLAAGPRRDGLTPGSWQAGLRDAVDRGAVQVRIGTMPMRRQMLKLLRDPDFALYKVQQTLYKFAFRWCRCRSRWSRCCSRESAGSSGTTTACSCCIR